MLSNSIYSSMIFRNVLYIQLLEPTFPKWFAGFPIPQSGEILFINVFSEIPEQLSSENRMACVVTKSWGLCSGMALDIHSRDSSESPHHCRDLAGIAVLTHGSFQPSLGTNLSLFSKHTANCYLQPVSSCCMSTSSMLAALCEFFQAKDGAMQDGQLRTGTIAISPLYYLHLT